jgi:hypothetical protein
MKRVLAAVVLAALALACRSRGREVVVYLSIDEPFTDPILASTKGGE